MAQINLDVMSSGGKILVCRISLCLRAADHFKFQSLARGEINDGFVRSLAAFANLVEVITCAGARLSDFVIDFELMTLRSEQFIARVSIGRDVLARGAAESD